MTFAELVTEYLKYHTTRELADVVECIPSTVNRWANGISVPMPNTKQWITNYINKLRAEEQW